MTNTFLRSSRRILAALAAAASMSLAVAQEAGLDPLAPESDRWKSEAINAEVEAHLKLVGDWLAAAVADREDAGALFAAKFSGALFSDASLKSAFADGGVEVFRDPAGGAPKPATKPLAWLTQFLKPFGGSPAKSAYFKTVNVQREGARIRTAHLFNLIGKTKAGVTVEQNQRWEVTWQESPLRIASVRVSDRELVRSASGFKEVTADVLKNCPEATEQLSHGTPYWMARIENYLEIYLFGQRGIALADVNGDGLDDVYVCQPGGLPNRLLLHQSDGTVRDASAGSGIDLLDNSRSALFADFDNDGDQDLAMSLTVGLLVFENDGKAKFTKRAVIPRGADGQSIVAADYDNDGDLDLYVCSYYADSRNAGELALPLPYFDANNGGANFLLRNDGGLKFTDVTEGSGIDANNRRWSWAALWLDYNNDGFQDLYVANDFGRNNLFLNEDGKGFKDVAMDVGLEEGAFGMSASAADFDRDGWMDLYVGNMFSAAGSRVTRQPEFQKGASAERRAQFQHLARGNSLFRNLLGGKKGKQAFEDVSEPNGVTVGRWSWSSVFADVNNDGWEDIVVSNGYISGGTAGDDL